MHGVETFVSSRYTFPVYPFGLATVTVYGTPWSPTGTVWFEGDISRVKSPLTCTGASRVVSVSAKIFC